MTIDVRVLAHSTAEGCGDIITIQVRYPWFIHPEIMTHRVFSRNFMSGRAVPTLRMLRDVLRDPAEPVEWGRNRPGMQSAGPLIGGRRVIVKAMWHGLRYLAVGAAWVAYKAGAHKQVVNRLVMPWAHIEGVITATEWQNFFDLRCHPAADPTMRALAEAIRKCIVLSQPRHLKPDEWHLPMVLDGAKEYRLDTSVAACARVSYGTHDGSIRTVWRDLELATKLRNDRHLSPFEHQALPAPQGLDDSHVSNLGRHWLQHRKVIE